MIRSTASGEIPSVMPRARRPAKRSRPVRSDDGGRRVLQYKVVELSNVDEGSLERVVNEWVPRGWALDGVQFAMRESSKRPSMAFVFFTREGPPLFDGVKGAPAHVPASDDDRFRTQAEAEAHLRRIVHQAPEDSQPAVDPWERLRALAGREDQEELLRVSGRDKRFGGDRNP